MKTALVLGISGQDGAYLARLLADKGYAVHGTSRDAAHGFPRLHAAGVRERVVTHALATTDRTALRELVTAVMPDEIYNLSGVSSVALSFAEPALAHSSIAAAHAMLLDVVRRDAPRARVYHSASSECFGSLTPPSSASERTPFAPRSPYAEAKLAAHRATLEARERGLYACSGLVFNHESPLRGEAFVTKKIVSAAAAIANGSRRAPLQLGDVSASRDWGYAPEYVDAIWRMLQQPEPGDFVLATGESHTVGEFAAAAFAAFDLDHRQHVITDRSLLRPSDLAYSRGDSTRARTLLGWEAQTRFHDLVRILADAERQRPVPASELATARSSN